MRIFKALVKTLAVIISCAALVELFGYVAQHQQLRYAAAVLILSSIAIGAVCAIFFHFYEHDTSNESGRG